MDKFIKRLQTRASRKGISVSKSQVREVYQSVVSALESPSEEEMSAVIQKLEAQYQASSHEPTQLTTVEESVPVQHQEETQSMPPTQAPAQPSNSSLATSNRSTLSQASNGDLGITQQQIQQAVEEQFGKESIETKTAILNYVAKDTFNTAKELQSALAKLRQTKLDILMKLISDHNQAASSDEGLLKNALLTATANRQRETEDFFGSFESQLSSMRAAFGV
ncbi:MAG TPA: hypothetical protein V6C95_16665 [Coleofasciculaceae cyanobacterium]